MYLDIWVPLGFDKTKTTTTNKNESIVPAVGIFQLLIIHFWYVNCKVIDKFLEDFTQLHVLTYKIDTSDWFVTIAIHPLDIW